MSDNLPPGTTDTLVDERMRQCSCVWVGASYHDCAGCEHSGHCDEEGEYHE